MKPTKPTRPTEFKAGQEWADGSCRMVVEQVHRDGMARIRFTNPPISRVFRQRHIPESWTFVR